MPIRGFLGIRSSQGAALASLCAFSLNTRAGHATFLYLPCPGGGMADAEDLKSSGDFSSCGFDSHPGHHSFLLKMNELLGRSFACTSDVPHFAKERADRGSR